MIWNDCSAPELLEMLDKFPWFTPARARLCRLTKESSGIEAANSLFRENLVYFPDGSFIASDIFPRPAGDYRDNDLNKEEVRPSAPVHRWSGGMDYFSREDYAGAALPGDESLASIAIVDYSSPAPQTADGGKTDNGNSAPAAIPASLTLAQIYLDQGYPDKAREIYEQLILHSPEKSVYFATLIEKTKNLF